MSYTQQEDLDYIETLSPVFKRVTVKLTLATSMNWPIVQLDVNNYFLHKNPDEEVYMEFVVVVQT